MTESLNVTADLRAGIAVIYTEGYLNNEDGEQLATIAYKLLDDGYRALLINLGGTKIVNSIGISILIELIEKVTDAGARLGFCCPTPTIAKTFDIMGLTKSAAIYPDEQSAVAALTA